MAERACWRKGAVSAVGRVDVMGLGCGRGRVRSLGRLGVAMRCDAMRWEVDCSVGGLVVVKRVGSAERTVRCSRDKHRTLPRHARNEWVVSSGRVRCVCSAVPTCDERA